MSARDPKKPASPPPKTQSPIQLSWAAGAPPPELDAADLKSALDGFLCELGSQGAALSVLIADDGALRELNRVHRGLDRPTDVLSWSYAGDVAAPGEQAAFGEVALSLNRAQAQAAEHGWPLRTEVLRLLAHGCAHIAGYDHETEAEERDMLRVEVRLLNRIGLRGVYPGAVDPPGSQPASRTANKVRRSEC